MKSNRYGIILGILTTFLVFTGYSELLNAQTPGQIFKPALGTKPNGQLVLDPNGDGFVSDPSCGITGFTNRITCDDLEKSEIRFFALPTLMNEPLGDPRTGPTGGHTEIVDGVNDSGTFMYSDDFALYFRMRIAKSSNAAKGYSFLINTNFDDFGVINGKNPGFDFEVVLQTGGGSTGVNIYDWTSGNPVRRNWSNGNSAGNINIYHQRAISGPRYETEDEYVVFYDFYVPWSELNTHMGLMTPSTPFRAAALTITNAGSGISGVASDINGIDDRQFANPIAALTTIVNTFPPATPEQLNENYVGTPGFGEIKSNTPNINQPVYEGATTVSGTSTDPNGTSINVELFDSNGNFVKSYSTTVTNFQWSISPLASDLEPNYYLIATAQAAGKGISNESPRANVLQVGAQLVCTAMPTSISQTGGGPNNIMTGTVSGTTVGTNNTNLVIRGWNANRTQLIFSTRASDGATTTVSLSFTQASGAFTLANPSNNYYSNLPNGTIITAQVDGQCESDFAQVSGKITQINPPDITSNNLTPSSTQIIGTVSTSGATILLYKNSIYLTSVVATGTNWTVNSVSMSNGDQFFARAQSGSNAISVKSNTVIVGSSAPVESTAPEILGSYTSDSTSVRGISNEVAGSEIKLYVGLTLVGTTNVNAFGGWEVTGLTLTVGNVLTATAQAPGKLVSPLSNAVTVRSGPVPVPTVGPAQIFPSLTSVTINIGNNSGATTYVYADGALLGTTTGSSVTITNSDLLATIREGVEIYAFNMIDGALSQISNVVVVSASPASGIEMLAVPQTPFAGDNSVIYATVVDDFGGAKGNGIPVTFSRTLGTGTLVGDLTKTTNNFGQVMINYATNSSPPELPETSTIRAEGPSNAYSNSVDVISQPIPPRPEVVEISPIPNATGVAVDATVSILFDRDIANWSLNGITIEDSNGNIVQNTNASLSGTGNRLLTINHVDFLESATYTVRVPAFSVLTSDDKGNPQIAWSFSTVGGSTPHLITLDGPGSISAGQTSSNFTITVVDSNGDPINVSTNTVFDITTEESATATITSTPVTVNAGSSTATFTYSNTKVGDGTHTVTATRASGDALPGGNSDTHDINVVAGAPTQLVIVTQPVGGTSGSALTIQPVVEIRDQYGNLVDDDATQVTVAIHSGTGGTLGGTQTITAINGVVTFTGVTLSGTVGEDYVLRFTSVPELATADSDVVNVSTGNATQIAVNNGDGQTATVGTAVSTAPSVIVRDASNNPVSGVSVTFSVTGGNGGVTSAVATTNAQGIATVGSWTMGTLAGSNELTATITGSDPAIYTTFSATGTPAAASQLVIITQPVGGTSGASLPTQPVIQIQDQYGNLIDDDATQVTVSIHSGTGGTLGGTQTVTANNGVATFSGVTLTGLVGQDYVLRFTSNPVLTSADSDNVNVSAGSPNANSSTITADPTSIVANNSDQSVITVQIKDLAGNNLGENIGVYLVISSGSGVLSGGPWQTDVNGQVVSELTTSVVGNMEISAYLGIDEGGTYIGKTEVEAVAGAPAKYIVTVSTNAPVAGGNVTVYAQLADQFNNPLSIDGETVEWTKSDLNGLFASSSTTTNANGIAEVVFTSHTVIGTQTTITATTGAVTGTSEVITTTAGTVTSVVVSGDDDFIIPASGSDTQTYTAEVRNQYGAAMGSEEVTWSLLAAVDGVSINPATGVVTVTSAAAVGSFTVVATSNTDNAISGQKTVNLVLGASIVTSVVVSGDDDFIIPASGSDTQTYTAVVNNQYGAAMGSEEVTWSLLAAVDGVSINPATGVVTVTSAASVGSFTVVATSNTDNAVSGQKSVNLVLGTSVVTSVVVSGDDDFIIPASGSDTQTYTAEVRNQYGAAMGSEEVTWSLLAAVDGVSINPTTGVVTVTSAAAVGSFTVVATSNTDNAVSGQKSVNLVLGTSVVSSVVVSGSSTLVVPTSGNTTTSTYAAEVRNQYGAAMGSEEVTWSLQSPVTGVSIDPDTGEVTLDDSVVPGTPFTVVATSNTDGSINGTFEVTPQLDASVVTSVVVSGDDDFIIPASGSDTQTYTAEVRNQYGAAMGSEEVTWSLLAAVDGVSINPATGVVTVTSAASVGSFTVVATSNTDNAVTGQKSVNLVLGTSVVSSVVVSGSSTLVVPTSGNTTTSTYSAEVRNQYGTAMGSEEVTWSLQSPVTGVSIDPDTGEVTLDDSVVPGTPFTVVATSKTDGSINGTFEVTPQLDASVVTSVVVSGDDDFIIPASGSDTQTYTAVVNNQYGAAMGSEEVTWSLLAAVDGVSINPATGVVTVTSAAAVGSFTVVATSNTDNAVSGQKSVNLVLGVSVVTSVVVSGDDDFIIPASGSDTQTYTAVVNNQYGAAMGSEEVIWSLLAAVDGVSINPATGVVTVTSAAAVGSFTVVATSNTDNAVSGQKSINLVLGTSVVTSVVVSGDVDFIIPASGSDTQTYTAEVRNQYGAAMGSEEVTWSLLAAVDGVSINPATGVVTVTSAAAVGSFTVVATSNTDNAVSGQKSVNLVLGASVVTSVVVSGDDDFIIPASGSDTQTYTAVVNNQYGAAMGSEEVTWSLLAAVDGVSINPATGVVTVTSAAAVGSFTVVATSNTDNAVSGQKSVNLVLGTSVVTSVVVSGDDDFIIPASGSDTQTYTAEVRNQYGAAMGSEEVTWSLLAAVDGVSINPATGVVTVTSAAAVGSFTVVATSNTDNAISGQKTVNLVLGASIVTSVVVSGDDDFIIPASGSDTQTYTAVVNNQYGAGMGSEEVTWSLLAVVDGVSINPATGVVTVTSAAAVGSFTVVATSNTDNAVSGQKSVNLVLGTSVVTSVVVSGDDDFIIPASGSDTQTYTAVVNNQYGAAMGSEEVTWSLLAAVDGVSINPTTGVVTVTSAASVGSFTVVATSNTDNAVSGQKSVNLVLGTSVVSSVVVSGSSTLVVPTSGNTTTSTYSAEVRNQYGAAMGSEEVTWSLQSPVTGVSIDPDTGEVTLDDSVVPGTPFTVVATSKTDGSINGTFEVTPQLDASVVTSVVVSGDDDFIIPASGSDTQTYTAEVRNQYGAAMGSEEVTWSLLAAVDGVSINPATGVVTVTSAASVGSFTVVATSNTDNAVTGQKSVNLVLGTSVVTSVVVSGDDDFIIPASGSDTQTYTAVVNNQYGAAMGSEEVTWSLLAAVDGVSINPTTGVVTVTSAASVGSFTVVATSNTDNAVSGQKSVNLVLGTSVVSSVVVSGSSTLVVPTSGNTTTSTYAAEVRNQYGAAMGSEEVTWSLQSPVTGVSIDPDTGEVTLDDSVVPGTPFTVVATSKTDGSINGTFEVTPQLDASIVTSVVVSGDDDFIIPASGSDTQTYTAEVRNQYGAAMGSEEVTWSLLAAVDGVSINPTTGVVTVTSAASVGSFTVVATSNTDNAVSGQKSVNLVLGASVANAANSSATVPNGTAGSVTTITINIKDQYNNPLSGVGNLIQIEITDGPNEGATFSSIIDNNDGTYTVTYTPTIAGVDVISIKLVGTEIHGSPFESTVAIGPISASVSTVSVSPASLQAGNETTVTVTIMDAHENRITGLTASDFEFDLSGDATIVPDTFVEVGNGVYIVKITNTKAEQVTVTVTVDTVELDDKPTITFSVSDISASVSTVTANPISIVAGGTSTITITLKDANGNLIEGIDLNEFSINVSGDGSVVANSLTEVGDGNYTVVVTGTKAEIITVTVTVDGIELNNTPEITITPDVISANESSVSASPLVVAVNGESTVTITLRDQYSNLISGVDLSDFEFTLTNGASFVPGSLTSTGNGVYTAKVTHSDAETISVSVTVDGTQLSDEPEIEFQSAPVLSVVTPSDVDIVSGSVSIDIFEPDMDVASFTADKDVTWSITGGSDQLLFSISNTGVVTFSGPSISSATPYEVIITATDNLGSQTHVTLLVTVITPCDVNGDNAKVSGYILDARDDSPLPHVMITLIPQGNTPGSILISTTGIDGYYEFNSLPAGSYLVQVQDENLNFVRDLYPVDSSLLFTSLTSCAPLEHNFEYAPSDRPVLAGFVWYDANNDGIVNEWFDANNDGEVTQNFPNENGVYNWDEWEWIDVNGNGTWDQPEDLGELNRAGFGNDQFENIRITGPNGYNRGVIVGVGGQFRTRPSDLGIYNISLVEDAGLISAADELSNTGLVKTLPSGTVGKMMGGIPISANNMISTSSGSSNVICSLGSTIQTELSELIPVNSNLNFGVTCYTTGALTAVVPNGRVHSQTSIVITLLDDNGLPIPGMASKLNLTLSGTNQGEPFTDIVDNGDGTYTVKYTPKVVGVDTIEISLNGSAISGSPFTSVVGPATVDASNSVANVPGGLAGTPTTITVTLKDAYNNPVSGRGNNLALSIESGPNTGAEFSSITDNGNGTYTVTYTPVNSGSDQITIKYSGTAISGSPYTSVVTASGISANTSTVVAQPTSLGVGQNSTVTITLRDVNSNVINGLTASEFSFGLTGNASIVSGSFTQVGNGVYTVRVTNTTPQQVTVTVTARGTELAAKPTIVFNVGTPFAANSSAVVPAGNVDQPTTITITLRDQFGNRVPGAAGQLGLNVIGANNGATFTQITDNGDGTYTVRYTPTVSGIDNVAITVGGNPISGSPFTSSVIGNLVVGSGSLPAWTQNEPGYSASIGVTGGVGPYTWSTSGTLPPGLTLNPNTGEITGTPTEAGPFTFSVTIIDSSGREVTRNYTIIIREADAVLTYRLVFTQQPNAVTEAGFNIGTLILEIRDQFGATNTEFNGPVSIRVTPGTGGPRAEDATLIGTTTVNAINGVVSFTDIEMERAGVDFTITASANSLIDGISDPFRITPGPPWRLDIREVSEVDAFGNPIAKSNSVDIASNHNIEGNRIPLMARIFDEFDNLTTVPEGDTPILLVTSSLTGRFYRDQTESTPIDRIVIPIGQLITIFYYEDPTPGELMITGTPQPPPGARDITPDQTELVIRMPAALRSSPDEYETVIFTRERIAVSLRSSDGFAVRAAYPGVPVTLESSSETGLFYSSLDDTNPVSSLTILPAESTVYVYYSDYTVGRHVLTFTGEGLPDNDDTTIVTIKEGPAVAANSDVIVPDGAVGIETRITVSLFDEFGNPVFEGSDQILVSISEGPNAAAEFTIIDNGDGTYTIIYVPIVAGTDMIDIVVNGNRLPGGPFPSAVRATEPAFLIKVSGDEQSTRVLRSADEDLVVRVFDINDAVVPGVMVNFEISNSPTGAEQAQLTSTEIRSDVTGSASTRFTAGTKVGTYTIKTWISELHPVYFTVDVLPCDPTFDAADSCGPYRYIVTASDYSPNAGDEVTISAQLVDKYYNLTPYGGMEVTWTTSSVGQFGSATSITNDLGIATVQYLVGNIVGVEHRITAHDRYDHVGVSDVIVPQGGGLARFLVVGPDAIKVDEMGGPFTLILKDEFENEIVANRDLSFQLSIADALNFEIYTESETQNLSRSGGNVVSIAQGSSRVEFYVSQNRIGEKTLLAMITDNAEIPTASKEILFYNTPEDAQILSLVAGQGQRERVLNQLAERLTVTVIDQFNNPIPGFDVTFQLVDTPQNAEEMDMMPTDNTRNRAKTNPGAKGAEAVDPLTITTDSTGRASVIFVLGNKAGDYVIEAKSEGLNPVVFVATALPGQYTLYQNYPNPFNAGTKILYEVPVESNVTITLYNAIGQRVATLVNEVRPTGIFTIDLDMNRLGLTSGVYVYHMSAVGLENGSQYVKTQKLLYVK